MKTVPHFSGGLRIVNKRLQIHVAGFDWDVSACPGIRPGAYVIVPAQRVVDPLDALATTSPLPPFRFSFMAYRVHAARSCAVPSSELANSVAIGG